MCRRGLATLMFSRDSIIADNHVIANRRHGLLFKQVDRSRITGNFISGTGKDGTLTAFYGNPRQVWASFGVHF